MKPLTSLLLVTKSGHARSAALAAEMRLWLEERQVRAGIISHPARHEACGAMLREAARGMDAVAVLGGDGTFIGVARQLVGQNVPFLGVNFGRLGFLTETPARAWQNLLRRLLAGKLRRVPRLVLGWTLERDGEAVAGGNAVNDVVVSRGNPARVATIHVSADSARGELGWIRADGVIVASPLGSSAYSLSARGPLVHPELSALLVTAVAPFQSSAPPLVLPGDARVRLQGKTGGAADPDLCLTVDGQEGHSLRGGDVVFVRGLPGALDMLLRSPDGYFRTLRQRGFIREFSPSKETHPWP